MKKSIIKLIVLLIIYGCSTKEIEIQSSFPFEILSTSEEIAIINNSEPILVTIDPERVIKGNNYSLTYKVVKGEGYLNISEGQSEKLEENKFYDLENLQTELQFVGTEIGDADVEFTVDDIYGNRQTITIRYKVEHNPFKWEINSPLESAFINQPISFVNILENTGKDKSITYEFNAYFKQGKGHIFNQDENSQIIDTISLDTNMSIEKGVFQRSAIFTELENNTIIFEATDSNGQVKKDSITINVDKNKFSFSAIASKNDASIGEEVPISFNVTETIGNSTYTMVFTTTGDGSLLYNGVEYNQGEPINIPTGNFVATYKGNNASDHDIRFTAFNANLEPISRPAEETIIFNATGYSISLTGEGSLLINNEREFFTILTQNQDDPSIDYRVRFTYGNGASGNGEIFDESRNRIEIGRYIPLELGTKKFFFRGTRSGDINLIAEVIDSNDLPEITDIDFTINSFDFDFSASVQDGSIELGESTNVFLNINETVALGHNYEIRYNITSSQSGEIRSSEQIIYNPNTNYPININTSNLIFNSTESGSINISFSVRNLSTLVTKEDNVSITVNEIIPDFNFSVIASSNTDDIDNCTPINFNLVETKGTSNYIMVFVSNNSGTFEYNGITYSQGQSIPVMPGVFEGCYRGTTGGRRHDVDFIVTNSNTIPITKNSDIEITYNLTVLPDFNFSTTSNIEAVNLGTCVNINFEIDEFDGISQYKMFFNSTRNGTLLYKGIEYSSGQEIPVTKGRTSGCYTSNEKGIHNIEFTTTNNNSIPISKSSNTTLEYQDYSISVIGWDLPESHEYTNGGRLTNIARSSFNISSDSDSEITISVRTISTTGVTGPRGGIINNTGLAEGSKITLNKNNINNLNFTSRINDARPGTTGKREIIITIENGFDKIEYNFTQNFRILD